MECAKCGHLNQSHSNFCEVCGASLRLGEAEIKSKKDFISVKILLLFYLPSVLGLSILRIHELIATPEALFIVDLVLSGYFLLFFLVDIRSNWSVLKFPSFRWKVLLLGLGATIAFAFFVFYSIDWMNEALLNDYYDSEYPFFHNTEFPFLFMILSNCVQPAIFEELAFRGFVQGRLMKIMDSKKSVFLVSAFLFALLHLSILSMYWLIPLAIAYAWLRDRYNTIWYGVIFHFTHNLTVSVLLIHANNEWSSWF